MQSRTSAPPPAAAAEQRAREFLAQRQWRKARDEAKPLIKLDRERYLPLLLKANIGLANELLSAGRVAEAQQVLAHLSTLAPADQLRELERELTGETPLDQAAAEEATLGLAAAGAGASEEQRLRWADALVLSFQAVPGDDPARARLRTEVEAVLDALLAASMGAWERMTERLRTLPYRSVFRHWGVFLKGFMGFHTGDDERMVRAFASLPAGSVPARAAQAYLFLANRLQTGTAANALPKQILEQVCRIAGLPDLGRPLQQAEECWREGRHRDAYRKLRDKVPGFPSQALDGLGTLTEFFFQAPLGMAEAPKERFLSYADELLAKDGTKNRVEEMLLLRLLVLAEGAEVDPFVLRTDWERFLQLRGRLYPPDPGFESAAYGWLGERLAQPSFAPGRLGGAPPPVDASGALEALRRSVRLDPGNLEAYLKLCGLYRQLRMTRDFNRLLDEMTVRFPENKQVLLTAGLHALDRRAHRKALDYLERAAVLDRLDPQIAEVLITARRSLARRRFETQRLQSGRDLLAQNGALLTDAPEDFHRARWAEQLRLGILERLHGDLRLGEVAIAEARASAPFRAAFALFAHLTHRVYAAGEGQVSPFLNELTQALREEPTVRRAVLLLRLVDYWADAARPQQLLPEFWLLRRFAKAAGRQAHTREEARQLIELGLGRADFEETLRPFVKRILKQDAEDPLFRLYEVLLTPDWSRKPGKVRPQLERILEEAAHRRDDETARRARGLLKQLDRPAPPPTPAPWVWEEDAEEDPLEALEDWSADPGPSAEPPLPPGIAKELAGLIDALQDMSEEEIQDLRQQRSRDIPAEFFDMMVEAVRRKKSAKAPVPERREPPVKPVPPAPRERRAEPWKDPNQLDLF